MLGHHGVTDRRCCCVVDRTFSFIHDADKEQYFSISCSNQPCFLPHDPPWPLVFKPISYVLVCKLWVRNYVGVGVVFVFPVKSIKPPFPTSATNLIVMNTHNLSILAGPLQNYVLVPGPEQVVVFVRSSSFILRD